MENTTKNKIDEIHTAINALLYKECWEFVDEILTNLSRRAWRTDVEELRAYAMTTFTSKSKLPSRERFIITCKHLYPEGDLWKGLI